MVEERRGKQEAKKVLKELQTNYDTLLQKFAAAENALGKCLLESERNSSSNSDTLFQKFEAAENALGKCLF